MDVFWYDVDLAFVGADHVWVVWVDKVCVGLVQDLVDFDHVYDRDVFGDGDYEFDVCVDRLEDGVCCKGWWDIDDGGVCASCGDVFGDRVEYGVVKNHLVFFVWGYVIDNFGVVFDYLFSVELIG